MKDWINKIHCGSALEILKQVPDKFIDCVMTSPPYWGLRDYGSQPQIWLTADYQNNPQKMCEHQWGDTIRQNIRGSFENANVGSNKIGAQPKTLQQGNFCQKCGAWKGELGLEPDFNLYIKHLCDIFDEIKRVLKDTGSIWVNLGDTYWGGGQAHGHKNDTKNIGKLTMVSGYLKNPIAMGKGYQRKSLCCIPDRFRIEMINRGWILRNKIEWFKRNCMPSSTNDRFTIDFEDICFFVKSNSTQYWTNEKTFELVSKQPAGTKGIEGRDWEWRKVGAYTGDVFNVRVRDANKDKFLQGATKEEKENYLKGKLKKVSLWTSHDYYFEQQFEEHLTKEIRPDGIVRQRTYGYEGKYGTKEDMRKWQKNEDSIHGENAYGQQGRNKRCVWEITTQPFPEAHFAVYPEKLCITPIKAGCPEFVCKKCKKPREKIYDTKFVAQQDVSAEKGIRGHKGNKPMDKSNQWQNFPRGSNENNFVGYADCGCNAGFNPGIVWDPFAGAGTTCLTARKLGRNYGGSDIKSEYVKMAEKRIHNEAGLL